MILEITELNNCISKRFLRYNKNKLYVLIVYKLNDKMVSTHQVGGLDSVELTYFYCNNTKSYIFVCVCENVQ